MTVPVRPAAAALALLVLAGCGGSSTPTAKPTPTPTPLTAAQAKTVAAAAVLTAADLPGYTVTASSGQDPDDKASEAAIRTCAGLPAADYLARDFGREFKKGDLEIDSSADVATSVDVAKAELAAQTSPKGMACERTQFSKLFESQGAKVTSFKETPLTVSVPGADAAFGSEFSLDATGGGETIQLRGLDVGALVGQVEIDVSVFATPTETVTLERAQALLATAVQRTKAALGG